MVEKAHAAAAGGYHHGISSNLNRFRCCRAAGVADPGVGADTAPKVIEEVDFAISCEPASQEAFEHAAWTLHSFWYPEALKEFTAIAASEPGCAMAYWGIMLLT